MIFFDIFRFSVSFIFSDITVFSIFSGFQYFLFFHAFHVLYFKFSLPFPIGFLSRKCFIYCFVLHSWQIRFSYQWYWRIDDFCGTVSTRMDYYFTTWSLWDCNTFCSFKWSLKVTAKRKMLAIWQGNPYNTFWFSWIKTRSRLPPCTWVEYCKHWWKQKCQVHIFYLHFLVASDPN